MVRQNPRKKKIGILAKVVLLLVGAYTVFVFVSMQGKIAQARARVEDLERKVELQRQENELLRANDSGVLTDEIIASIVRDKLGYVLPGERIFKDESRK